MIELIAPQNSTDPAEAALLTLRRPVRKEPKI